MSNQASSSKKRQNSSRDRDKSRMMGGADSGGSSQCDTPPLTDKESTSGKYAGVSPESVQCMAEQVGEEVNVEAIMNLAEDVSYKLRQVLQTIALHSELFKKSTVDSSDVNCVLRLMDSSNIVGCTSPHYSGLGDEKLCHQIENLVNTSECALQPQMFVFWNLPTLCVEWITEEKSLPATQNMSTHLHNYYTNVARAILSLKKNLLDIAVRDLTYNTKIGPIFPNLFNLAVLVLNDDNLNALNVPEKIPLQSNVLEMVDALCSNPCSLDTNITQQFQRLFPVMVSNILGNGSLSEKMVSILTKITRTWPHFVIIGKGILLEYLSQGSQERLTSAMIRCVGALGRQALLECLGDRLHYIDDAIHTVPANRKHPHIHNTLLDVSTCLLRWERTTWLEDYVETDYTLYEMLGDSILPRRLQPHNIAHKKRIDPPHRTEEDMWVVPPRMPRRPKFKHIQYSPNYSKSTNVFEPTKFHTELIHCRIKFNVSHFRNMPVKMDRIASAKIINDSMVFRQNHNRITIANGLLNRFRFKLHKRTDFPLYSFYPL